MIPATSLAAGLAILAIVCLTLGFAAGYFLRPCIEPHPLKGRPLLLTAYQCRSLAAFSDGQDVSISYKESWDDYITQEHEPAGLYVTEVCAGRPASIYLAVSIDDDEFVAAHNSWMGA